MASTSCIRWQAESTASPAQLTCLHVRVAHWAEAGGEFKSKFGVRSGVHLSVHLRSVMRSAESFSREKHLITASVLRAPVAFEKGAKSLFSKSSERKLITSAQTPGRDWEVWRGRNYTGGATVRGWGTHAESGARQPLSPLHTSSFQFDCKQDLTLQTFLFCCGGRGANSPTDSTSKSSLPAVEKILRF